MQRWPMQMRFVDDVALAFRAGRRVVLVTSPTGTGKSVAMGDLIEHYVRKGFHAILYTNRRILIDQLSASLTRAGIDHGIRAAGQPNRRDVPVQVSSLPSENSKQLKGGEYGRWTLHGFGRPCLVVLDEAHVNTGPTARELIRRHKEAGHLILLVTATPIGLGFLADELVVAGKMSEGFACGALVPSRHYGCDEPDRRHFKNYDRAEDFSPAEQRKAFPKTAALFGRVGSEFDRLNPGRNPTILFASGVEESLWFAERFCDRGVPAAHIDGDNVWIDGAWYKSDRQARAKLWDLHRERKVVVICNRFVMREGVDLPWVEHLILACVIGSLQTYLQMVGRGLRAYPEMGKAACVVQDHGGCLDTQTEILTSRGWVGHDQIRDDDTVAAYDRFNGSIVWKPILHRHERILEPGESMYEAAGKSVNIRVTGNHRLLMNKRVNIGPQKQWPETYEFGRADELSASNWRFQIPVAGIQRSPGVALTDDQLRFIGWFITDGTMAGKRQALSITQADHQPQIKALRECLIGAGLDFRESADSAKGFPGTRPKTRFRIPKGTCRSKPRRGWWPLRHYLDKDLSPQLDLLTPEQFDVLINAIHLGDGAKDRGDGSYRITTGNKRFADRLQALAIRKGWKCNIWTGEGSTRLNPIYVLNMQKVVATTLHGSMAATSDEQVKIVSSPSLAGVTEVWCVANELETLVTRRDGKVAIIGNSWWRHGSVNVDRDWQLKDTAASVSGSRRDRLRWRTCGACGRRGNDGGECVDCGASLEKEPYTCPNCSRVLAGRTCFECGWVRPPNYVRSRAVLMSDGRLVRMRGDIFRAQRTCRKPNALTDWVKLYHACRKKKDGGTTFAQARALYAREHDWQWPDPAWPYMPKDPMDFYSAIRLVDPADLIRPREAAKA